jgi:hypothetical protein
VGREGAAAPAGLELQLGRGAWRAAHGSTAWRAAHGSTAWRAAGAGGAKGGDGSRCQRAGLVDVVGVLPVKGEGTAAPPPATYQIVGP